MSLEICFVGAFLCSSDLEVDTLLVEQFTKQTDKKNSSEIGEVQGLKMGQTPANVQRKTFKDFQKACSKPLEKQTSLALRKQNIFLKNEELLNFAQYCTSFLTCRVIRSWQVQYRNRLSSFDYFYHCMCISDLHLGV